MNWIVITFLHAIVMGIFRCAQKKSIEKTSIYDVLAWFSLIAFLLGAITSKNVLGIEIVHVLIILGKAIINVLTLFLSLSVLKKMSVGLCSILNLSGIIFSVIMSWIFLGEKITITVISGMIVVILGLILVNLISNKKENKENSLKAIAMVLISCLLNSISAIIDKKILEDITSHQLLFWFFLFLTIIYWIILLVKKKKIDFKDIHKNYWILITAICLTIGDRLLYIANEIPESKVSIMTIIKQFSVIETIILGKIIFKEEKTIIKLICSILIIIGIALTLI